MRVNAEIYEALLLCEDYFDSLADVDDVDGEMVANWEMTLLILVREALSTLESEAAK